MKDFDPFAELEAALAVPCGFFHGLLEEKDGWAFVIKLHAFLEGAVSHMLTEYLGHAELAPIMSRLDMNDSGRGKIAFLKGLKLIEQKHERFLRSFSELRNKLVHDVRNVSFDLNEYVQALAPDKRKSFCEQLGFVVGANLMRHVQPGAEPTMHLQVAILASAGDVVNRLYLGKAGFGRDVWERLTLGGSSS